MTFVPEPVAQIYLYYLCFLIIIMASINLDKSRLSLFKKTKKELLKEIKPDTSQTIREKKFIDNIIKKIEKIPGSHLSAVCAGSFGKGTHLKDTKDFDVFVIYPPSLNKEKFIEEGLSVGQKVFKGYFWEKAYSQHSYIRGVIDGHKIEIVPSYKIEPNEPIISAVDRTTLHLMFIEKNMSQEQKDETRILKFFLKHIGAYGADTSVSGFSGYLCELLILFYGDFKTVLENVCNWKTPVKFTLLKEQHTNLARFSDPLVVIDPVDDTRNVASAVSLKQLSLFIAASRIFIENPSIDFFRQRVTPKVTYHQLLGKLENFSIAIVRFEVKDLLKEIVWSKVKSNTKKLITHLEFSDFDVLKYDVYHYEGQDKCYLIILLNTLNLPRFKKIIGPLVSDFKSSQNYISNNRSVLGPYIKDDRWYVIRKRDKLSAKSIILDFSSNFDLKSDVFVSTEINSLFLEDDDLSYFLTDFFISKEKFLI
jgi:tRNA nucleotidyltransferase (CCA-adding enzyme)